MTTPEALNALADRVEREEPSWRLTCEIEAALHPGAVILKSTAYDTTYMRLEKGLGHREWKPPAYLHSLDAAVTLVPDGASWVLEVLNADKLAATVYPDFDDNPRAKVVSWAKTPAAALTAASLRARADMQARAVGAPQKEAE